jgi:hypothetical protein
VGRRKLCDRDAGCDIEALRHMFQTASVCQDCLLCRVKLVFTIERHPDPTSNNTIGLLNGVFTHQIYLLEPRSQFFGLNRVLWNPDRQ